MATDKPMAPEERVRVDHDGDKDLIMILEGCGWSQIAQMWGRDGAAIVEKNIKAALREAYDDGQRAENEACAAIARGTESAYELGRHMRVRVADAIAARREA